MDHRGFIASLDNDDKLRLTRRSDLRGLAHLASHWLAIMALAAAVAAGMPGWPVVMVPLGMLLVFQFTLLHETVHDTPFASDWLNRWIGRIAALLVFMPRQWFRYFHLAHHRHTQDPENDPELEIPKPETLHGYVWHMSGIPYWRSLITTFTALARGRCDHAYVPPKARARVIADARAALAVYAAALAISIAAGSALLLWVWVVPLLIGQPLLRLFLLAEHGRCPFVANMFENTRTTFTTAFMRWLSWNMPFHAEHHALPTVPFHRLPELHRLTQSRLRVTENGYARFHRGYVAALND